MPTPNLYQHPLSILESGPRLGGAFAAGLTDHRWTVAEMIEQTASYQKPKPGWPEFLDTISEDEDGST